MAFLESEKSIVPIETFSIHFDLPDHQIPLRTFVDTARQTELVIQSLNNELFDGRFEIELLVLAPEAGSFKTRLGIVIVAGWAGVWSFAESDVGKAFVRGLTNHEPAYWAEQAGVHVRHLAFSTGQETEDPSDEETRSQVQYAARIVGQVTQCFMQAEKTQLASVGVTTERFHEAIEARNQFYQVCISTPDLNAIGFTDGTEFPIGRSDFTNLIVPLTNKSKEKEEPWYTAVVIVKVTSPNWVREDRQRQWKGRDAEGRERFFRIEDEHFWGLIRHDQLDLHVIDTMKVQWAFRGKLETPRELRVLTVMEFNGERLSERLDDNALGVILGLHSQVSDNQQDLFDD
jgi:hypothetical protein